MLVSSLWCKSTRLLMWQLSLCSPQPVELGQVETWGLQRGYQGHHHSSPTVWMAPLKPSCVPCLLAIPVQALCLLSLRRRRTWWHLSWQQLSDWPINYTEWLTPSATPILFFISASGLANHLLTQCVPLPPPMVPKPTRLPITCLIACSA